MDMILIYDGKCGLCSYSVKYIKKFDNNNRVILLPQASKLAMNLFNKYKLAADIDSVLFVKENKIYFKSDAVIEALVSSNLIFSLLKTVKIIPRRYRDYFYDLIARNRNKIFNNRKSCAI